MNGALQKSQPRIDTEVFSKKVICFDFFDTLVKRKVSPEHVKRLWAREIAFYLQSFLSAREIYEKRSHIEKIICQSNHHSGCDQEFQYDHMIELLYQELFLQSILPLDKFKKLGFSIEISLEKSLQTPISDNVQLLHSLSEGRKVYVVSDFYLPSPAIEELAKYHGFSKYISGYYASSDLLLTKRSGKLFHHLVDDLGVQPTDIAMIGDNPHSDVAMPNSLGLNGTHLPADHAFYDAQWQRSSEKDGIASLKTCYENARGPFSWLGSTLFVFTRRLHATLLRENHKEVFFLAREGEFLKELFDLYQEHWIADPDLQIQSKYLKVSRRSTYLPSLKALSEETFSGLFNQYRKMSVMQFLKSINIDPAELQDWLASSHIDLEKVQEDLPTSEAFKRLTNSDSFKIAYEAARLNQHSNLKNYIGTLMEKSCATMAIVDVGWKGSIQNNLARAFPDIRFFGYYLGLVEGVRLDTSNPKHHILFRITLGMRHPSNIFNENRALFEMMLAASHGSTVSYNSKAKAVTEEIEKEQQQYHEVFRPIQLSIRRTFINFCENFQDHWVDDLELLKIETSSFTKHILLPSDEELNIFSNLVHYENFGFFDYTKFSNAAEQPRLIERLKNLYRIIRSPRDSLLGAWWKPLIFRQMGLSFLSPLFYVYKKTTLARFRSRKSYAPIRQDINSMKEQIERLNSKADT